ncbi:sensor histidine kinase [Actinoplanes sp. CA-051413]|uniref:sensor histidine kinase n=1 Tax=Actinoplanes sp. CA-051413 TaxID=3239899 RepID=UPI003D97ABEE
MNGEVTSAHTRLLTGRPRRRDLIVVDSLAAAGYTAVMLTSTLGSSPAHGVPVWGRVLLIAAMGLPLAVRRIWPVPVFTVVLAASVAAAATDVAGSLFVAAAFALYPVALTRPPRPWLPTRVIGVLTCLTLVIGSVAGLPVWARDAAGGVLLSAVLLGGAWTLGRAARERHAYAERSAAQLTERAVAGERLRIARELHDIVAHSMGVIAVKAGVAHHVMDQHPEVAREALGAIETTSRSALTELRQMLGVLRSDSTDDLADAYAPPQGLAGLPALAERAGRAGVKVDLRLADLGPVPEGVELCIYRIVQESLTNVVKHAAPASCEVRIGRAGGMISVEVTDDGPGRRQFPADGTPGLGLIGMRERVTLYDGTLEAGPLPRQGFRVSARLPFQAAAKVSA